MPRFVRVTIHPAGMVTLMEMVDGEQLIAVGVSAAGPWIATALDVTDGDALPAGPPAGLHVANRDN